MPECLNHPGVPTEEVCADCRQPFCPNCLVEFLGNWYCGPCRDRRLRQMQGEPVGAGGGPYAGTGTVDIGRWLGSGWQLIRSDLVTFAVAMLLSVVLSVASCGILLGPLYVGLFLMVFRKMTTGRVEMAHLFDGFRRFLWAFVGLLLLAVGGTVINTVLNLPAVIFNLVLDELTGAILTAIYQIVSYVVFNAAFTGATLFVFPLIAARNSSPVDAVLASWEVFTRNPVMFCVLGLLLQLLQFAGVLACFVGILVIGPVVVAAMAQAYADHFGLDDLILS